MSLSEELKTVLVPVDSGVTASLFLGNTTMGAIAAAFHVTLPPANLGQAERQGYLRSWQSAANYVVSRLYDPSETVDEAAVVAEFQKLERTYNGVAESVRSALTGNVFQTVFRLFTQPFRDPFEVTGESIRSTLLYVYSNASAGVGFHSSEARNEMAPADLDQDYLLRLGAFQAIVAMGRSGLLDPIAKPKPSLGALPVGVLVLLGVAIIAVAALLGYVIHSIYATSARNRLMLDMQRRACEADPSRCGDSTAALLSSRLAQEPGSDNSTTADKIAWYAFYAALAVGGFYLLPSLLRAAGATASEVRSLSKRSEEEATTWTPFDKEKRK